MKRIFAVVAVLAALGVPAAVQAAQWVPGDGDYCPTVCAERHATAVDSGTYKANGNRYYICRANAGREGWRPGYNLQPGWARTCTVGHGGQEVASSAYDCLCE